MASLSKRKETSVCSKREWVEKCKKNKMKTQPAHSPFCFAFCLFVLFVCVVCFVVLLFIVLFLLLLLFICWVLFVLIAEFLCLYVSCFVINETKPKQKHTKPPHGLILIPKSKFPTFPPTCFYFAFPPKPTQINSPLFVSHARNHLPPHRTSRYPSG